MDKAWPILKKLLDVIVAVAAILGVWEFLKSLTSRLTAHLPRRAVLGDLARDDVPCMIFACHLYTPTRDNKYKIAVPDYWPPRTTGMEDERINTPRVIATADAIAIADVLNAAGQVGRYERIEIVDPVAHWRHWDCTVVCVGGSFKSEEVFRKCKDLPVIIEGSLFKIVSGNRPLQAVGNQDFGLICKTFNPENGRDIWLVIGLGGVGTESAGFYLRNNLRALGAVFGKSPFSIVVRASITGGGRQATLFWHSGISWYRKLICPIACRRFSSSVANLLND